MAIHISPLTLKKFLLGHNFLFLMGEDSILLGQPWVAGLGTVQTGMSRGVPSIGRRFL